MPSNTTPHIYFSIDYRSPPSGLGQIIDTSQPRKMGDKWNMILMDYGANPQEDPFYVKTQYFKSQRAEDEGWPLPVIDQIIQYLQECGVTHVYDSELSYDYEGADDNHYYTLEKWTQIMMGLAAHT